MSVDNVRHELNLLSAFTSTIVVAFVAALPMALVIIWVCSRLLLAWQAGVSALIPHVGAALPHELQIRVGRSTRVTIHRFGVLNLSS
jgi:hypothetical protein